MSPYVGEPDIPEGMSMAEWRLRKMITPKPFKFYRAPWNRWFKTHFLKGSVAYELQVGPAVFMLHYSRKLTVWLDRYWRV